jgi:hypothetical protein
MHKYQTREEIFTKEGRKEPLFVIIGVLHLTPVQSHLPVDIKINYQAGNSPKNTG